MRIAITGGSGSGKSLAAHYLADKYDGVLLEADKIAHELYEPGNEGYMLIKDLFGERVLSDNFKIDRKALSDILYSDTEALHKVNTLIHPLVYNELYNRTAAFEKADPERLIIYESAILPEDTDWFDSVWYIHTDSDIRRKRLKETRGYSDRRVDEILANQPGPKEYSSAADIIIENNSSSKELEMKIDDTLQEIKG